VSGTAGFAPAEQNAAIHPNRVHSSRTVYCGHVVAALCERMKPASRSSWKTLPLPSNRKPLELSLLFSDDEGERIRHGHIPEDMDDKWFIFFEDGWLYFHRSWTGQCIYGIRLDGSPNGVRTVEAWVNDDNEQYNSPGLETDLQMVQQLISSRLLS
jgi:hypothetical protein